MSYLSLVLPPMYAAVGVDWYLYYSQIVRKLDTSTYTFTTTITPSLTATTTDARGTYSTPVSGDIGPHTVEVQVLSGGIPVDSVTSTLTVVDAVLPATKIITVGDSITQYGYYQEDLISLNANITTLGTKAGSAVSTVRTEGYETRTAYWLQTDEASPFVVSGVVNISSYLATLGQTPHVITWLLGTNDAREYANRSGAASTNRCLRSLDLLLEAWKAAAPTVKHILCGSPPNAPSYYSVGLDQNLLEAWSLYEEALLRKYSDSDYTVCGVWTCLDRPTDYSYPDGFHPDLSGHVKISKALYPAIMAARTS